ncbi:hypothetical protein [Sphingobium sp. YR768]|uniref:hypothetical protein n=1 Tax=Sphingobium sp. YR768 TaxID=1884365 RepID=UPI0008C07E2D|nr:hypothetical protein [Sphingobium sp. YR768]SES19927.1 hypothetical protein SAMN05518866_16017 [Sphingobium sp. YR768]
MSDNDQALLRSALERLKFHADFQRGYGADDFSMRRSDADIILVAWNRRVTLAAPAADEPVAHWRSLKRGPYVVYDKDDETYLAVGGAWHLDLDDGDSFAVFEDAQRAADDAGLGKVESYWVHQCPDLIHDAYQQFAHSPAAEPVGLREAQREAVRTIIAETAADLSTENPAWTAGCLADALISKGVGLINREYICKCGQRVEPHRCHQAGDPAF